MGYLLPTMDSAKLDLQRDVVKNERRERTDNQPYGRAYETIIAALYPSTHPYSWPTIGSMADLSAASLEDVKQFFRTYYAPNNATITIAGAFDRDSAKAWVSRYFGGIPRGPQLPPRPQVPAVALQRDTFLVLEDRVQLPRLYSTWHTVKMFHADDAALDVLAYVLAGDKNSRLYKRLVYEAQTAQDVSAGQNSGRLDGMFIATITPKPGQTPAAMARVLNAEVAKVIAQGITRRELERAQNSFRASFIDRLASVSSKADILNSYNYFVGTPDYAQEDAARYDRVTVADVQRVAREYLGRHKVVLTVVPEGQRAMMVSAGDND
jgi:zinc protease